MIEHRQEIETLLHFLSHDVRAPLRGIKGYSQLLLDEYYDQLDVMGKAYLEYIQESSNYLSDAIEGLLKLYRIEQKEISISRINLSEIANEICLDLIHQEPERNLQLNIQPEIHVDADYELIQQLMRCLIDNAFKFSTNCERAQIEFNSYKRNHQEVFFLRDNGAGFNMAYQEKLFIPFQRLHSSHEFKGIGLGLAIAQRIILQHHGQIWAESEPGKGTTIYFTIQAVNNE